MEHNFLLRMWATTFLFTIVTRSTLGYSEGEMHCNILPIPATTNLTVHCTLPVFTSNLTFDHLPINRTTTLGFRCNLSKNLSQMGKNTLSQFVHVRQLRIRNCKFESFPEGAFQGLGSLNQLQIEGPKQLATEAYLPSALSPDLRQLSDLELTSIGFSSVQPYFWCNLPNLKYVSFVRNKFPDLKWLNNPGSCNLNLTYVDMENNLLTTVPPFSFQRTPALLSISLRLNSIKYIHEQSFDGLRHLRKLVLSYNNLTTLPPTIFQQLVSLQKLYLAYNNIKTLPYGIFNQLGQLTQVMLDTNYINFVNMSSEDPFRNLQQLKTLSLSSNNISFLPHSIFRGLSAVHTLILTKNNLPAFNSSTFVYLKNLRTLFFQNCNLTSSDFLIHLPLLEKLYATNNKLLRPNYRDLLMCKALERIDLGGTGIRSLAFYEHGKKKGIFSDFKKLNSLKVNKNAINHFDYFMVPDSVTFLDLTKTSIHTLDDQFGVRNEKKISTLFLNQNTFLEWNNSFFSPHVEKITCNECTITNVKSGTFRGLHKLKSVWFLKTAIENVERFAFRQSNGEYAGIVHEIHFTDDMCSLTLHWIIKDIRFIHFKSSFGKYICQMTTRCKLVAEYESHKISWINYKLPTSVSDSVSLDCGNNNMTSVTNVFRGFNAINYLFLDGNILQSLGNGTFDYMTALQYLFLNNSCVTYLEGEIFRNLTELTELYLHDNRLQSVNKRQFIHQRHLAIVWLQNNRLSFLERAVFSAQNRLTELRLNNNFLFNLRGYEFLNLNSLQLLYLNSNNLSYFGAVSFRKQHQLSELHLENNTLWELPPRAFSGAMQLKILHMNQNNFTSLRNTTFSIPLKLQTLHLANNMIFEIDPGAFRNLAYLEQLYLSHNNLRNVFSSMFSGIAHLKSLYLDNNHLNSLHIQVLSSLNDLHNLTLHNNKLENPVVWNLPSSVQNVTLRGNTFSCDCSYLAPFYNWVMANGRSKVFDGNNIFCKHKNGSFSGLAVLNHSQIYCLRKTSLLLPLLITGGTFCVVIIIAVLGYMHRLEMKVWLYSRYGLRLFYPENDADIGRMYHAFVAFSTEDEEFIAHHLVPGLEPLGFKLCIHSRDFPVGAIITSTVCEVVENSCRTLLVLTTNFVNSEWCKFEFKMAHFQTIQDRCCRLIVIILEDVDMNAIDIELKVYLKTNTYLKWGDPFFWEKLRFAMPDIEHLEELDERQPLLLN